jgi:hypothetical protein
MTLIGIEAPMRRSVAPRAFALFALIVPLSVHAAETAVRAPDGVAALIAQLGDPQFRVRQSAGRALEAIGEPALPLLREASKNTDEEIRRRAEVLCERMERAALLSPRRVSLAFANQPIETVVKEIARQTGYQLQYQGGAKRKVTIDLENATYWEAIEQLCRDGQLSPGFDEQLGIVYLYQQNTVSPYVHHDGPFRFVAQNFSYSRHVNLANLPRNQLNPNNQHHENTSLVFGFVIQAEPKIPLLSTGPIKLTRAEDEHGDSLLPRLTGDQAHEAHYFDGGGMYRNFQHSTGVALARPAKDATRAKIIRGKAPLTLLAGVRPDVVVENFAKEMKKVSVVGRTAEIEIEKVTENNNHYTVTMTVKRLPRHGDAQDYNWINCVPQKLELCDEKGRKYQSHGVTNFINQTPSAVQAEYQFGPPPAGPIDRPVKLMLVEWLTMPHEIEFEFKDLPLP